MTSTSIINLTMLIGKKQVISNQEYFSVPKIPIIKPGEYICDVGTINFDKFEYIT